MELGSASWKSQQERAAWTGHSSPGKEAQHGLGHASDKVAPQRTTQQGKNLASIQDLPLFWF